MLPVICRERAKMANIGNWFKAIEKSVAIEFNINGYKELPEKIREVFEGFSLLSRDEGEFHVIHLMKYTENDLEVIEMIRKELLANDFQELRDG
jgi:hypothetical protein